MAEGPGRKDLLVSWKEISAFLSVDKRTCARWEKSLGLPIHRMAGASKSRVFAYRAELEAWAREKLNGHRAEAALSAPEPARPPRRGRRLPAVAGAVAILAAAAAALVLFPSLRLWRDVQPARIEVTRDTLESVNRKGRALWTLSFPEGLSEREAVYQFVDLDGDGRKELLWSYTPKTQGAASATLLCLSDRGKEKWRYKPGRELITRRAKFPDNYLIRSIHAYREPSLHGDLIVVLATQNPWEPCQVSLLDARGKRVGEYWNNGHFNSRIFALEDLDGDGVREIILAGENNAHGQACLAVLDPRRTAGVSPQTGAPEFAFPGMADGRAEAYLLFPRSPICDKLSGRNRVSEVVLRPEERTLEATVVEYSEGAHGYALKYLLDYSLRPLSVVPEDDFSMKLRELQGLGMLGPGAAREIETLADRIESWRGERMTILSRVPPDVRD